MRNRGYDYDRRHGVFGVRGFNRPPFGDKWRYGFNGRPGFRENNFFFGFYIFSPFIRPCYVSPWYYYPGLPPYVDASYVRVVPGSYIDWNLGTPYAYQPDIPYNTYGDASLNVALADINAVFLERSQQAVDDLISNDMQVAVYSNGQYQYSIGGGDFEEMMLDNANNTETTSFQITSVRYENGQAVVRATHWFHDSSGGRHVVYQIYRLRPANGRYVITDFMTTEGSVPAW